jgi:hypothetical protein
MLDISDPERYARYSEKREGGFREFVSWALLFESVGGIASAIRGRSGGLPYVDRVVDNVRVLSCQL